MSWFMTTQSSCKFEVILKDSSKTYVDVTRAQVNISPPLAIGYDTIAGSDLMLVVTNLSTSITLKSTTFNYSVVAPSNQIVGQGFSLCIEDNNDDDFNDLYVNLIAWVSKG